MPIWKQNVKLGPVGLDNPFENSSTIGALTGLRITEIGEDYLRGTLPVDARTHQPFGRLHGGASCVLAEELGSVAGTLCLDSRESFCVGLEINANHVRGVFEGTVTGTARPLHIGRQTQVWDIRITDERERLVCVSRLTLAVVAHAAAAPADAPAPVPKADFAVHPQLAADCFVVGDAPLCRLLLLNDAQYPWFLLVPRRAGIREIYELGEADRSQLQQESALLGRTLMALFGGDKLNVAALGNIVPQLHLHHIVRRIGDAAWPAPVWGRHPAVPYETQARVQRIDRLKTALGSWLLPADAG